MEVGRAKITIEADGSKARTEINKTKSTFSEATEKIQQDASRQVGAFTGLIGAVTASVGVFASFLTIGSRVANVLEGGTSRARTFTAALAELGNEERLKRLSDEAQRVQDIVSAIEGGGLAAIDARLQALVEFGTVSAQELRGQASELRKEAKQARDALENEQTVKRREAERAAAVAERIASLERARDIQAEITRLELDQLDGAERITREVEERQRQLREQFNAAGSDEEREALRVLATLENERANLRLRQIREEEEERERLAQERRRKDIEAAREAGRAMAQAAQSIFDSAISSNRAAIDSAGIISAINTQTNQLANAQRLNQPRGVRGRR